PVVASVSLPPAPQYRDVPLPAPAAKPSDMLASLALKPTPADPDDEDAAEARRDDALEPAPSPYPLGASSSSGTKPNAQSQPAPAKPVVVAAAPKPAAPDPGEGDISGSPEKGEWNIQIGAFNDLAQARNQLAAYAKKSVDLLGQAPSSVVPF